MASAKRRPPLRAAFAAVKGWWEFGAHAIAVFIEIIAPIFGIVLAGWLAARLRAFDEARARGLSLFAFNFAIPVLLLRTVAQTELPPQPEWRFVFAYFGGAFAIFALGAVAARLLFARGGAAPAIFGISACFSNTTILGIPIVLRPSAMRRRCRWR